MALAQQSGSAAQALGWYAYNIGQSGRRAGLVREGHGLAAARHDGARPRPVDAAPRRRGGPQGLHRAEPADLSDARLGDPPVSRARPPRCSAVCARRKAGAPAADGRRSGAVRRALGGGGGSMAAAYRAKDYGALRRDRQPPRGVGPARSALGAAEGLVPDGAQPAPGGRARLRAGAAAPGTAEDAAYGEALARLRSGQASRGGDGRQRRRARAARSATRSVSPSWRSRPPPPSTPGNIARRSRSSTSGGMFVAESRATCRCCAAGRSIISAIARRRRRSSPRSTRSFRPRTRGPAWPCHVAAQGAAGGQMMRCRLLPVPLAAMLPLLAGCAPSSTARQRADGHRLRRREARR